MPLEILALLVVAGVGGIVLAIHLTGGTITAAFDSEASARRRFAEDFPGVEAGSVLLTANRQAAVLDLPGGAAGIVYAIGDRFLTRYLDSGAQYTAGPAGDATISLRLDDISWRGGDFTFASVAERDKALALLRIPAAGGENNG